MNINHLPDRYRLSYDFVAVGLPRKALEDAIQAISDFCKDKPFCKEADAVSVLRYALSETVAAENKVKERLANTEVHKGVGVSISSRPCMFVTASAHGSFGLDGEVRQAEETLKNDLAYCTPLWDDYSGRSLTVSHSIYCG